MSSGDHSDVDVGVDVGVNISKVSVGVSEARIGTGSTGDASNRRWRDRIIILYYKISRVFFEFFCVFLHVTYSPSNSL